MLRDLGHLNLVDFIAKPSDAINQLRESGACGLEFSSLSTGQIWFLHQYVFPL